MSKRAWAVTVACLSSLVFTACGGGHGPVRIVCVDSTISTQAVRASYLPGLKAVAADAARDEAPFYVAACGGNPNGTVTWPIHRTFQIADALSGELAKESAEHSAAGLSPRLVQIIQTPSTHSGTPLGEMLAVAARQCAALGGGCRVYMFSDGEWADQLLRVRYGVTIAEQRRYVAAFAPRLHGLHGSSVYFVGGGRGTGLREMRLAAAQRVATALVEAAGGRVRSWSAQPPREES